MGRAFAPYVELSSSGIEYVITEDLFDTLPQEERKVCPTNWPNANQTVLAFA